MKKKVSRCFSKMPGLTKVLLLMKLTVVLILLTSLQLSAKVFSQNTITLKLQSAELKKALTQIEKKSSYRFLYNDDIMPATQKVNINADNTPVTDVLDNIFTGTELTYKVLNNNLVVITRKNTAFLDVQVSGKVTDASGEAIPQVSVKLKGANVGTSTGSDGSYALTVPEGATLIFSSIGYETIEIKVNGRTEVNVTLKAVARSLDEIVVVGYGTQKKRDLTGSISSVKGEELARMPSTNPLSSLQGKVAGLTVTNSGRAGSSPVVRIRGINSTNSASPVYVVDGILQDNIDYLNPADIESIDILRDPSSIAIYGLRGANGVIAVTSKKAARGQTRISLTSSVGIQKVNDKIKLADANGFKTLYSAQLANLNSPPFDYTNYTANTNWQDEVLRSAVINSNNLSISNTGEKSTTYLNIGYTTQDGVLKNDNYQRYIVRLNEEIRFTSKIKVGAEVTGYHSINNPPSASITNALWAAPIVPIQFDENTYYSMPSFQRAQVGNPVATLNRNDRNSIEKGYRIIGNLYVEIKFLKNFTWKSTVYTDLAFNIGRAFTRLPYSFINLGEGGNPTNTTFDNNAKTSVIQEQNESKRFQQDHILTFDKKFGSSHSITALVGFTTVYTNGSFVNGTRRDTSVNIPNDPDFWYIGVSNANNPGSFGGGGSENSIAGAFGRISYAYQGKYLLNATIRRDGSSKFSPENRWGTFGSVGAGWVLSDEKFFNRFSNAVSYLKIRGAWGLTGNANGFADNLYKAGISNSSTAIFGDNIYTSIQAAYIPDPNLHWETVQGTDIGFDLKTLGNRLNAEVTYYNRTTKDILTALPLPNDSRSYFTNLGKITNKGIEVNLGWNDNIGKDISYGVSGNFSYNKNVVNSIGDKTNFQVTGNGGVNLTTTGKSIGYFYGYRQVGIYQSTADLLKQPALATSLPGDIAYADINGDGMITSADRTYLGTPFPPYSYGGSISIGYKNLDLQIEGQGSAGNKIYTQRRTATFTVLNYEANRLNAWTGPGTSNIEPVLDNTRGNNFLMSTYFLEPGDYFRLRTIQLGYTLGKDIMSKTGLQKARIYISGQNIKSWTKVTGYSPEPQIGSILGGGADNGAYPVPATYTFGINLTF